MHGATCPPLPISQTTSSKIPSSTLPPLRLPAPRRLVRSPTAPTRHAIMMRPVHNLMHASKLTSEIPDLNINLGTKMKNMPERNLNGVTKTTSVIRGLSLTTSNDHVLRPIVLKESARTKAVCIYLQTCAIKSEFKSVYETCH